jgi:hypothetical protein
MSEVVLNKARIPEYSFTLLSWATTSRWAGPVGTSFGFSSSRSRGARPLTAARGDRVGAEQRRVDEGGACSVTRGAGMRSRAAGSADPAAGVQDGTKIPGT